MAEALPGAGALLAAPAAVLLIAVTAYIGGRTLTRAVPAAGGLEIAVLSLSAGLLMLAHLGLALGLLGHLSRGPVLAAFAALHGLGLDAWRELRAAAGSMRRRLRRSGGAAGSMSWRLRSEGAAGAAGAQAPEPAQTGAGLVAAPDAAVTLTVALAPAAALALYPPIGFDAILYHLPFAKAFAATGHLPFLPALRFPVFPQLNEMLFALGLLLDGDLSTQLLMVLATLLTAGLLVAWGRSAFGAETGVGWLAAAVLAGNPLVIYLAGNAYVDAGLALWVTAALFCLHRFRRSAPRGHLARPDAPDSGAGALPPAADRDGAGAWAILAGAFAGGAAAGKYLGLFFVVAIAAIVAWTDRRRAVWFTAAAVAVMAPWYGRIVYYTHNPLFPYFPRWFGSSPWDPLLFRPVFSPGAWAAGLGPRLLTFVRLPWSLSFGWRSAGAVAPLSPVYLAALPLLAVGFARRARIRRLLLLGGAFALATLWLPREPRYIVAVLPAVSLATAGALAPWLATVAARCAAGRGPAARAERRPGVGCFAERAGPVEQRPAVCRLLPIAVLAALLLPGFLYGADRLRRFGPPPASADQRESWLMRRLPVYPALRFLNRSRGSAYTAFALHAENLQYYAAGTLLGDWTGPASFLRLPALDSDPDAFARALRRLGAGYLISPAPPGRAGCGGDDALHHGFRLLFADAHACVFAVPGDAPPGAAGSDPGDPP
jgi:hypothetical protein